MDSNRKELFKFTAIILSPVIFVVGVVLLIKSIVPLAIGLSVVGLSLASGVLGSLADKAFIFDADIESQEVKPLINKKYIGKSMVQAKQEYYIINRQGVITENEKSPLHPDESAKSDYDTVKLQFEDPTINCIKDIKGRQRAASV